MKLLEPTLKNLFISIKKHITDKKLKEKANITLRALEENGSPDVAKTIQPGIPVGLFIFFYTNYSPK